MRRLMREVVTRREWRVDALWTWLPRMMGECTRTKAHLAKQQLEQLMLNLEERGGGCTGSIEALLTGTPRRRVAKVQPRDPWGTELRMWCTVDGARVRIESAGKDRRFGTGDDVRVEREAYGVQAPESVKM